MSVKFVSPLGLPVAASDQANNLGQIYFNSTTKKIRVYKNSGWTDIGGTSSGSSGKPGMVTSWAGSHANVPTGWLLCDGSAVSRSTYADLFAIIGDNFGAGNGTTTFNLPNYQDYWLVGGPDSGPPSTQAPDPSGNPSSWVVQSGVNFYNSFSHSTNGSHSLHSATINTSGSHSHTVDSHDHTVTTSTSGSATESQHTASGVFGFGGAAHTHSITSGANSTSGTNRTTGTTSASLDGHTHVVSLASSGASTNHVDVDVSYSGNVSHVAHTHAAGSGTSSSNSYSTGSNSNHTHTLSAVGSSGGHAHASHDPQQQMLYYIIKT